MAENRDLLNEAECCEDYTPRTYLGMCRIQQNAEIGFARAQFTNRQIATEQAYWDEMEDNAISYYPSVMCDPCAKAPVMSIADQFTRRYAKPFILKNRATVTCGEVKHRLVSVTDVRNGNVPRDNISNEGGSTWLEQFRDYMATKTLMQSAGFDKFEEDIAWELMITGKVVFPETEYLPEGLTIQYPRHTDLDYTTKECLGKGQCDSMGLVENWIQDITTFNDAIDVTDIFMHHSLWREWRQSDDMKECLKTYQPGLFLGPELLNRNTFNIEPLIRPKGVTLVYTDPNGIRYWTVNIQKRYCLEDGSVRKYDMFPRNRMMAFDLSGSQNSWQPEFIYTPIMDVFAALEEPDMINAARYAKTYTDKMNECWERRLTSNLMVALRCPNSSSQMEFCVPETAANPVIKANAKAVK